MAFSSGARSSGTPPIGEINMVPLIDVMLVLLVIFIVTAPLLTHSVRVELPKASSRPDQTRSEPVAITIDASGRLYWESEPLNRVALRGRLQIAAARVPRPGIQLRADSATPYRVVAEVMSDAARVGMTRITFITVPDERN